MFGTLLFGLDAEAPAWLVRTKLYEFIAQHSESLGVAAGVRPWDLGLVAYADFRGDGGGLQILRFAQSYRQIPVFGPDATVRLVTGPGGVLGIRGAIVDGRVDFKFVDGPSSAADAEACIRYYVMEKTGLAADGFAVGGLRLVAVPRSRSLGWAASADDGLRHVATVVVAAGPGGGQDQTQEHPALLYFNSDVAEGLEDPVDVVVLAEDPASDILSAPVSAVIQGALFDATPLHGSQRDDEVALADARVVAYDAAGVPDYDTLTRLTPPEMSMDGVFGEPVGSSGFAVQSTYVAVQNMYAWTDRFMAGKWESLLGAASSLPPGTFRPRLMVLANVEDGADPCPPGAAACVNVIRPPASGIGVPKEYKQPLEGPNFEYVSYMALPGQGVVALDVVGHEFGHFVDLFASPGLMR